MNNRTSTLLAALVGAICGLFIIHLLFFAHSRTVRNDVVQGFFIGFGLAFVSAQIVARIKTTKVNGWLAMCGCGVPGNGMLFRAACAQVFPGPINVPQEAMYWTTSGDGAGHTLSGKHDYLITGPKWSGPLPGGATQISSPRNAVLVISRVLLYADSDLPLAHALATQIRISAPPDPSDPTP